MSYQTITKKEDYKEIFGLDLDIELGAMPNDTGEKPSTINIRNTEEFLKMWFSGNGYMWDGDLKTDHQTRCFKKAVCYQLEYVINSDSMNHSGFSADRGLIISRDDLRKIGVSIIAEEWMRRGGMANFGIKGGSKGVDLL